MGTRSRKRSRDKREEGTAAIRRNPKDEAATKSGPTSQDEKPKRRSRSRLIFLWCTSKTTKTCDYNSHMDWPRFWGQFSENIDKTSVAPITKFTYLRELVTPQVSRTIEALPFTAKRYNRAKSIWKEKFGKDSEIIKAYTKEILELPTLTGTNPKAISDFSEKLTYCVQALQTLNKLEQVNGATLMTLDKLPGIRVDLVRTDAEWEKWDFAKLSEAIRLWTTRNPVDRKSNGRDSGERRNQKWDRSRKLYQARGQDFNPKECVYCGEVSHKPSNVKRLLKSKKEEQH